MGAAAAALGSLIAVAAAGAAPGPAASLPWHSSRSLDGYDGIEWCAAVEAGQILHYRFRAGLPLGFSIHYHTGSPGPDGRTPEQKTVVLLRHDEVRREEAEFRAPLATTLCLHWQNQDERTASLEIDVR